MGGGQRSGQPKSSNWKFCPKRRCCIEGCKKRAREIINGKPYCKKHRR